MKRLLLVAVLLVAACGGGNDGEPGGVEVNMGDPTRVEVTYDEPLRVGPVTWAVTFHNSSDALKLDFTTGQRADVSLTGDGEVVYQWSRAQMFTQVLATEEVAGGESLTFTLDEPGLDVDPGRYTLKAWVTASDEELFVEQRVTVEPLNQ